MILDNIELKSNADFKKKCRGNKYYILRLK